MSYLTTHVLDASRGLPAAGVAVRLIDDAQVTIAQGRTDTDGRIAALGPDRLPTGVYHLTFAVGDYYADHGIATFYPSVTITVALDETAAHYHVPLLLSPFAYSTYRGS